MLLAVLITGCGSESDDLTFSIFADPSRTHAPGDITFELTRDDGEPVTECSGKWDFGDGITLAGDYEASHHYRDAGKYKVSVALTCDDKKGKASTDVEVFGTVDLGVAAVEARPLDISTNGTLSVSFQVSNGANNALQIPTYIDIYLTPTASETAYLESGASRIFRHTLPSLPAAGNENSVQKIELDIPLDASIRTGAYYLSAVINPDHQIGEVSYANNVAFGTQAVTVRNQATDGADFVASRLQVSPPVTSILTSATAQFDIINQGSTTAETFRYEVWIGAKDNAENMDGATKIHESTIDGGMSGVEQSFKNILLSITPAISDPGLYYFWLVLDPNDAIVERDESNNTVRSSAPIQITNEPVLDADITVEKLTFAPTSTNPGGTFSATVDLYNQGSQPTGSFVCTIFLSNDMSLDIDKDSIVGSLNVDNLLPLSSQTMTGIMETDTGITPGKYWVYAFCDSSGVVSEANEDNNIQRSENQLVVTSDADIDLVFGPPQLESTSTLNDGNDISMSVMYCNKGSTSAGPSYVSVMRINRCDNTETEFSRILVEGMDAGHCENVYAKAPLVCDFWCPNYAFYFIADSTMIVDETEEKNNTKNLQEKITMSGDNCVCAGDKYEPNDRISEAALVRAVHDDLTLCPNDADLFQLDLVEGETTEIHLSHDHLKSPLELSMIRGSDVISSVSGSDDLYLTDLHAINTKQMPTYVKISGLTATDANRYHLDADIYSTITGIDLAASTLKIEDDALNASDNRRVSMILTNLGKSTSPSVSIGYYLSRTTQIDDSAWRLARQTVSPIPPNTTTAPAINLKLPADTEGGSYFLIAKVDDENEIKDARPSNNIVRTPLWKFERSCWDILDPNDTIETARTIPLKDGQFHQDELAVCQNNPDFYVIDMKNGYSLDITATTTGTGDFDLVLYDQNFNEIVSSRTGSATESIHRDAVIGDQKLYLQVFLLENIYNAKEAAYTLDIKTAKAPEWLSCNADFEPNDYPSSAYDLVKAAKSGKTLELCPSTDEDYYKIDLHEGDRLQLGFKTEATGLRAALYVGTEQRFLKLLTNPAAQGLDYTATEDNTYYLRIYTNVTNAPTMPYQLQWLGTEGVDMAVSNLKYAPEIPSAGSPITVDYDIHNRGSVETAYNTAVTLTTNQPYTLATASGKLAPGATENARHKITIPSQIQGFATLSVTVSADGDESSGNDRQMLEFTILAACMNDDNEPNDNILRATPIEHAIQGTLCPNDEDWFKAVLTEAAAATLKFSHENGDLDLEAYDENGELIGQSTSANDIERIELPNAGTYYLRVRGSSSSDTGTYELTIE